MKKLSKLQVVRPSNDLDDMLKKQITPSLSQESMEKIAGGFCDAVCLPSEMGSGHCPCNGNLAYG